MNLPDGIKQAEAMQAYTAEETSNLISPLPEDNILPISDEQQIESQLINVAQISQGSSAAARIVGRVLNPSGRLSPAWHKLRNLELKQRSDELRKQGLEDPVEAAVEALRPKTPKPPSELKSAAADDSYWLDPEQMAIYGSRPDLDPENPIANLLTPSSRIADEATANDGYLRHITVGDADMDRILADRIDNNPLIKDGIIAGIRAIGKGGDVKVPDEHHIRVLLSSIGAHVEKQLKGKTPDEMRHLTQQQLVSMGDLLGENAERLKINFMGGLQIDLAQPGQLAAQMVAGKKLLINELAILDKITDEVMNTPLGEARDLARLAWRQQAEMVAQLAAAFKGTTTDIARALNALKPPAGLDDKMLRRDVTAIVDDLVKSNRDGKWGNLDEAIEAYSKTADEVDRLELTRVLSRPGTWTDAIYEVWINSILSGYWSHVKNAVGNISMILGDNLETYFAATGQVFTKGLRGQPRDVAFGEASAKMFGQIMAMREALGAMWKGAVHRSDPSMLGHGSKLDSPRQFQHANGFSAQAMPNSWLAQNFPRAVNFMGSLLTFGRAPMRALQAEDAFFKTVSYKGSLYEQAWASGRAMGLEGDEFSTHVADFIFHPPEEAIIKAQDLAKYVTLQSEMVGQWKDIQKALRFPGLRWLVPFFKTPTNALLYVGERSPVARWTNRYDRAMKAGGSEAAKARTRWAMGNVAVLAIGFEYMQGNITGGISADSRIVKSYERQNVPRYSYRIGDDYYSYAWIEPISSVIGIVADTIEVVSHPDTDDRTAAELMAGVIGAIGYNMTNKTFMAGISQFLDAIRDPHRRMESFVKQYAASAIPGSAMFNEMRKLNDDLKRFKFSVLDAAKAKLPWASGDLGPQRDLWGRLIVENRITSPYRQNPRDDVISKLRLPIPDHDPNYGLPKGMEFTVEERDFFLELAGEKSKKFIDDRMKGGRFKADWKNWQKTEDPLARQQIWEGFREELKKARSTAFKQLLRHRQLGGPLIDRIQQHKSKMARPKGEPR